MQGVPMMLAAHRLSLFPFLSLSFSFSFLFLFLCLPALALPVLQELATVLLGPVKLLLVPALGPVTLVMC